jgi:hypothetical protein
LLLVVGDFSPIDFLWVLARLCLTIWLFSTAFSGFEIGKIAAWSRLIRLVAGFTAIMTFPTLQFAGFIAGIAIIVIDSALSRRAAAEVSPP